MQTNGKLGEILAFFLRFRVNLRQKTKSVWSRYFVPTSGKCPIKCGGIKA